MQERVQVAAGDSRVVDGIRWWASVFTHQTHVHYRLEIVRSNAAWHPNMLWQRCQCGPRDIVPADSLVKI
jgi:hypothetical protein